MRALAIILASAVTALWIWFAISVGPRDSVRPVRVVEVEQEQGVTAASLHNIGVSLNERGQSGDALLYFERAHAFRPMDAQFAKSYERQEAFVAKRAWLRVLVPATLLAILLSGLSGVRGLARRRRDRKRLGRLRLRGDNWFRIRPDEERAALSFRFNHDVQALLARHPLTIVWSSARHGKHMKSQPPVEVAGRRAVVSLEGERLERLRRFPGDWKGFLYLDGTPLGEATARVG
ncbi:MAG: hypothetical protein ACYTGZ_16475 [Planctomycetota bacterium]|jgi:hypothetical protein